MVVNFKEVRPEYALMATLNGAPGPAPLVDAFAMPVNVSGCFFIALLHD